MTRDRGRLLLEQPPEIFSKAIRMHNRRAIQAVVGISLAFLLAFVIVDWFTDNELGFMTVIGIISGVGIGIFWASTILFDSPRNPWRLYENGFEAGLRILNPGFVGYEDVDKVAIVRPKGSDVRAIVFHVEKVRWFKEWVKERRLQIPVGDLEHTYREVDAITELLGDRGVKLQHTEDSPSEEEHSTILGLFSVLFILASGFVTWGAYDLTSLALDGIVLGWLSRNIPLSWIVLVAVPIVMLVIGALLARYCFLLLLLAEKPPWSRSERRRMMRARWNSAYVRHSLSLFVVTSLFFVLMNILVGPGHRYVPLWLPFLIMVFTTVGGALLHFWLSIQSHQVSG